MTAVRALDGNPSPHQIDETFLDDIRHVADAIASVHANDVDRAARFPIESIAALKSIGALSAAIDPSLGGRGVSFAAIAEACLLLGSKCAATAMVFAMHQIQVFCLLRHAENQPFFARYLRLCVLEQRLLASATSEVGNGGDLGKSIAAATEAGAAAMHFVKQAPTISYGAHCDDLLTTLRRNPEAESGDQLLVLSSRGQHQLEQMGSWDPLGMRGTCSPGFRLTAEVPNEQILPDGFDRIARETMIPVSHILWAHVWLGIATDAFERARAFVRQSARQKPGQDGGLGTRLSHLYAQLQMMRSEARSGLADFLEAEDDRDHLAAFATALRFNNLKIVTAQQAAQICQDSLEVIGIAGYRNDTPFSVGRHIRDSLSASLMIANERIHSANAGMLLIAKSV